MLKIEEIKKIDKKHIALMDTSSISFMQSLQKKEIMLDSILKDYELILIPKWVLTEIEDYEGRVKYVQKLIDEGYWSSTRNVPFADRALCLYFIPNFIGIGNNGFRNGGFTIRPVTAVDRIIKKEG